MRPIALAAVGAKEDQVRREVMVGEDTPRSEPLDIATGEEPMPLGYRDDSVSRRAA